ncbi:hypothetical protein PTTG_10802, partial [Puccinia triticina 1-1 BBBD Race 1]|uniref:Tet-like 2OG-Fe(II) oxygenase domain-containing protein n=1 Tax=Puccinia triticina (isolate 1-1 / race 1 (BBBD)) TaxID=630390 RepID=A0A0C4FC50_PUCT1
TCWGQAYFAPAFVYNSTPVNQSPNFLPLLQTKPETGLDLSIRIRKRIRPNRASARWARYQAKAEISFILPTEEDESPQDPKNVKQAITAASGSKATFYYFVPPQRQHDPNPKELLTSQETLKKFYCGLSFGTCVIAPRGGPGFCKFQTIPFSAMSPDELQGWEKLVCFFLDQTDFVAPVKNNGPLMGGWMWACGWWKGMKKEGFGQYCSVGRLAAMIKKSQYNDQDEAAAYQEANEWIATHLQELAPLVFKEYCETLIKGNLPSMAHMEYPTPYNMFDFASFFTFTMHNFFNGPHADTNANTWTLLCWIPIFNPQKSNPDDPILADTGFDMIGGQFTFRDFQVYIDLNEVVGVTMCVFRSGTDTHQTLDGCSPSEKYTRIGFSCQMSEKMSNAVVAYIQSATKVAGQKQQIADAHNHIAKEKRKKISKMN